MSQPDEQDRIGAVEWLTGFVLFLPIRLSRMLPYRWRVPFAGWLTARVIAPLAGYNRRVRNNLAMICPALPAAEVARIMRGATDNAGRNMIELYSPEFSARARRSAVVGPGLPTIRVARAANRPVIFVTGHFGSFNAARMAMIEQGFEMGVFYRPMANRPFNAHYIQAMARLSEPMFEQGRRGMIQMVRHLRGGGVVAILNDLNALDGLPLEFFGRPALTSLASAEMALKYDAPLVPVWGRRLENGLDFEIIAEREIPHSDPLTMTREFNRRLEARVRADMDQWFWIHRRWKDGANAMGALRAVELEKLERELGGQG